MYGNKAIAMITHAPYIFLIEGRIILKFLKYSEMELECSKIPTYINA